jgi:hypothetical protein
VGNYEDAREWLTKALRAMERLDPVPVRALAFTQVYNSYIGISVLFMINYAFNSGAAV